MSPNPLAKASTNARGERSEQRHACQQKKQEKEGTEHEKRELEVLEVDDGCAPECGHSNRGKGHY